MKWSCDELDEEIELRDRELRELTLVWAVWAAVFALLILLMVFAGLETPAPLLLACVVLPLALLAVKGRTDSEGQAIKRRHDEERKQRLAERKRLSDQVWQARQLMEEAFGPQERERAEQAYRDALLAAYAYDKYLQE